MTPINASDAAIGATYLTQRGLRVKVEAHVTNGTRVVSDDGVVSILDRAHKLTATAALHDNDAPATLLDVANVIGKPKAIIADVICDLTDDQLTELEEADTRAFIEFLVRDERAFRAKSKVISFAADNAPRSLVQEAREDLNEAAKKAHDEAETKAVNDAIREHREKEWQAELARREAVKAAEAAAESEDKVGTYPPADDTTMERMRESSEDALQPDVGTYPPTEPAPVLDRATGPGTDGASDTTKAEPAPRKFPRGWCPVCGHEGMLTASGRIRAHQREGAPCEGQQALHALTAPPTPASLHQAEVDSVPEAKPGSTEPCDLHDEPGIVDPGSDYETPEPVGPTATLEQQVLAREAGYRAAADGVFTPPTDLTADEQSAWTRGNDDGADDLRNGVVESVTGRHMAPPVDPPGAKSWVCTAIQYAPTHERAAELQAHLRALADAIPAMLAGQAAIDRLKALGLDITATLGVK